MKKRYIAAMVVFFTLIIIFFSDKLIDFIIDIQWFKDMGYISVYFTPITAILKLILIMFILFYIGIWLYYKGIRKNIMRMKRTTEVSGYNKKKEKRVFIILNSLVSLLISYLIARRYWYEILQFTSGKDFNVKDPIFNKDVAFYIFKLPLIDSLNKSLIIVVIFIVIVTVAVFFIMLGSDNIEVIKKHSINSNKVKSNLTKFAGKQLALLGAVLLLLVSIGYLIKGYKIVYSPNGVVYGAGYTDIKVTLLMSRVLAVTSLISGIVVCISTWRSKIKPVIISISSIVVLIIIEAAVTVAVEELIVNSNQVSFESQYINYNMEYTRKAFNIDNIKEIDYPISNTIDKEDIKQNTDIIDNIKLNSFKQSLAFYNQLQVMRYYYSFNDIDIDRYMVGGKYSQVFISPREINSDAITPDSWVNKHLIYTHGYGVAMSKVNSVNTEGQPDFIIKDIPEENKSEAKLQNPRIYFGENTNSYALVNTDIDEFDYPNGGDNKYHEYAGNTGIRMNIFNKVLFAIKENNIDFLISEDIHRDSKILIHRGIMERIKKIAPFLKYDSDPYMAIAEGKLYWVVDSYTYSDRYPYSEPNSDNINYIRNSVKVLVDAYNGHVDFYIIDEKDPIIQSYNLIFNGLFKSASELPKEIIKHFKYPEDLFNIQSKVISKYHTKDPMILLTGEDIWQVSTEEKNVEKEDNINQEKPKNDSSYIVTRLPDGNKLELTLLKYFNVRDRESMTAMLAVRMDGESYGEMVLYKFPIQQIIYGTTLFQNKKNQDAVISKELTLWNTNGSRVEFGDIMIIPINNSLLYIEPMYLIAQGTNSIPEMKRVIISNGEKIVMAETIDKALGLLLGIENDETKINAPTAEKIGGSTDELINQSKELYNKAMEAQKQGDFTKYAEYIEQLGKILNNK